MAVIRRSLGGDQPGWTDANRNDAERALRMAEFQRSWAPGRNAGVAQADGLIAIATVTEKEYARITRKRAGETQSGKAKEQAVSRWEIQRSERAFRRGKAVVAKEEPTRVMFLSPHEWVVLQRFRAGWNQSEVSARFGMSRLTIGLMEAGKTEASRLIKFWEEQGNSCIWRQRDDGRNTSRDSGRRTKQNTKSRKNR